MPPGTSGGDLSINEQSITTSEPAGFNFFGQEVVITTDITGTTASNPFVLVFRIDSSIVPAGEDESSIQIFDGGFLVAECPGSTIASPDPCVSNRANVGGDIEITVLTSTVSPWNFGFQPAGPDGDAMVARIGTRHAQHLTVSEVDSKRVFIAVVNKSAETRTIGVYVDLTPPTPSGCEPTDGKILRTFVTLDPNRRTRVFVDPETADAGAPAVREFGPNQIAGNGLVEFHCTETAADGQPYHWKVAVDVNGDDLVACSGPGGIDGACATALADDDPEGTVPNNIKTRDLPIVRIAR